MQVLIIAGNVGKDAVLRRTQDGDAVLGFSLAVDNGKDRDGNQRPSTWYDCSIWGKRAESLERHIVKGLKLALSGRPSAREHEGKAYLGITVDDLTFMGGGNADRSERQDRSGGDYGAASGGSSRRAAPTPDYDDDPDSIPF
jgi:single-strand DNA-binding protein